MARFKQSDIPSGDFHAVDIADKFYPDCVFMHDSEGRVYNRALPTIYRLLRKMRGILEIGGGLFYNAFDNHE